MSDLRTAAQQTLEALEWHYRQGHSNTLGGLRLKIDEKALRNLRAALAQQDEPVEPVAWVECDGELVWNNREAAIGRNLYTAPPQRKPLTKESLLYIYNQLPNWGMDMDSLPQGLEKFARAVEQAHGIKE